MQRSCLVHRAKFAARPSALRSVIDARLDRDIGTPSSDRTTGRSSRRVWWVPREPDRQLETASGGPEPPRRRRLTSQRDRLRTGQVADEIDGLARPGRRGRSPRATPSRYACLASASAASSSSRPRHSSRNGWARVRPGYSRPLGAPGDIEHPAALGVLPASLDDGLLDLRAGQGLGRGLEPGPDQRSGGTQSQGRGHAPPVGDPARGQDRRGCRQVHHDRHEGQRGPAAAGPVPAGSVPWATMTSAPRSTACLASSRSVTWMISAAPACRMSPVNGRGSPKDSITALGRYRSARSTVLACHRPALETDPPGLAGALGDDRQLAVQPVQVPAAPAEQAQPAAVRDRRAQRTAGRSA